MSAEIICVDCGSTVPRRGKNHRRCSACSHAANHEHKRRYREINREAERNRANLRDREKTVIRLAAVVCVMCGRGNIAKSTKRRYCDECAWKRQLQRAVERRSSPIARGLPFMCEGCGSEIRRRASAHRFCATCSRKAACAAEYRRRIARLSSGGRHSVAEWWSLCESHLWKCSYCGADIDRNTATKDHRIPVSRGGSDSIDNILPACVSCNCSKGSQTAEEYRAKLARRLSQCELAA